MANATEPQNDRELLLKLNGEIEKLAVSITNFSMTLKDIEEKKIALLENRMDDFDTWRNEIRGGWKLALAIWAIITAGIIGAVKAFWQ